MSNLPEWHGTIIEPDEQKKLAGWIHGERVPAEWLNWLFNTTFNAFVAMAFRLVLNPRLSISWDYGQYPTHMTRGKGWGDTNYIAVIAETATLTKIVQYLQDDDASLSTVTVSKELYVPKALSGNDWCVVLSFRGDGAGFLTGGTYTEYVDLGLVNSNYIHVHNAGDRTFLISQSSSTAQIAELVGADHIDSNIVANILHTENDGIVHADACTDFLAYMINDGNATLKFLAVGSTSPVSIPLPAGVTPDYSLFDVYATGGYIYLQYNNGSDYDVYRTTPTGSWEAVQRPNGSTFTNAFDLLDNGVFLRSMDDRLLASSNGLDNWFQVSVPDGVDVTQVSVATSGDEYFAHVYDNTDHRMLGLRG